MCGHSSSAVRGYFLQRKLQKKKGDKASKDDSEPGPSGLPVKPTPKGDIVFIQAYGGTSTLLSRHNTEPERCKRGGEKTAYGWSKSRTSPQTKLSEALPLSLQKLTIQKQTTRKTGFKRVGELPGQVAARHHTLVSDLDTHTQT